MSRCSIVMAITLALLVSACTGDETTVTSAAAAATTSAEAPLPTDVADLPGRLVVIDEGGNISTMDPDGSNPTVITDDAGDGAAYRQPTFSPVADRLAWSEITATGFGIGSSTGTGDDRALAATTAPPFFTYWSPDGSRLGVLHNSPQGTSIEFELVDMEANSSQVLATGSPFYFSWSPDSTQLAAHVERDLFATLDLDGNTENLGATAQGYQAPHWTPEGIIHLTEAGIELHQPGGEARLLATAPGPVAFVANPQGDRLAIQSFVEEQAPPGINAAVTPTPALPANRVVVLDVETGEVAEVVASPSIGLFWSPDGRKLLALRPGEGAGELTEVIWHDGETTELSDIAPHPAFVGEVLQFFDQYGQSLRIWSPDSAGFALAGAIDGEPGIWVHTIGGGDPVEVGDGSWVSWSGGG